ncbi:MAG TPA: carboxy terminal-processing peptidase [Steroidobacteraceae bacterium]|nr:carboxy terminal-processing peptidase [Steroidobacteraceae bacterium]
MIIQGPNAARSRWKTGVAIGLSAIALAALLGAAMTSSSSPATAPPASTPAQHATGAKLEPTTQEGYVAQRVADIIAREHYRREPLDDQLSSMILDRYLNALDGERSYFYAADIADFDRFRYRLGEAIKDGDMQPAFAIFRRYQRRARERMEYAISLLAAEPDFNVDESYHFDRSKRPWPVDKAEMNGLWRKRVKNDELSLLLAGKKWPGVVATLRNRYEHVITRINQTEPEDVFETFMNAYTLSLDPHSNYFSPRDSQEYNIQMSLSYEGIGASLQLHNDYVTVVNVIPGGPAAISGKLAANDRITAIGEGSSGEMVDVIGWRLDDVVQKIRGPGGTRVRLQILPAGAAPGSAQKTVTFTRNRISLNAQAAHAKMRTVERGGREVKIGVIKVPSFYQDYDANRAGVKNYRSTTRDVKRLIAKLRTQGMQVLIMDLRGNGGGYLPEAESMVGLFIHSGPVVQLRDTTGRIEVDDDPDSGTYYSGPLIVLVDRLSASASEIFAGALQDYGRAVIVGQQTYGKGTVQNAHPLSYSIFGRKPDLGQLNVTIGKYYRITGGSTQDRGVMPDISMPSLIDVRDVGENTHDRALPWDQIQPAKFTVEGNLQPTIAELRRLHDARMKDSPGFRYLQSDIAAVDAMRAQKSLSLSMKVRQAEQASDDRALLARQNAWRAANGKKTLKSVQEIKKDDSAEIILAETAQIAADYATLHAQSNLPAQARVPVPASVPAQAARAAMH